MSFQFLDLQRPQYPSSPEVLLSALAWSVVSRSVEHRATGLIYSRRENTAPRKVLIEQTMPRGDTLVEFGNLLEANGLGSAGGGLPRFVSEAATDALLGAQPLKGKGTTSSAIGLCGALLQDPVGGLAVKNPPNFAKLLNTMHALGGPSGPTAAERWFEVAREHSGRRQLRAIEAALAGTTLKPFLGTAEWPPAAPVSNDSSRTGPLPAWWVRDVSRAGVATPFSWFRNSWDHLCSPAWYAALPPRRWAGWAVCVLRNALGFAFLWEANFFFELARGIVDTDRDPMTVAQWALSPTKPLIPYRKGSISQMDVRPSIKQLLSKGLACRNAILEAANSIPTDNDSLEELVRSLREDSSPEEIDAIKAALGGAGDKGGLPNLIETVRYSLLTRGTPDSPDQNSLLRVVSRNYTHVVPGPEWIVVMSALSAESPSSTVRLGDVRRSLDDLGFKPRIDFLLSELERAGLCASAPDGDEGIEINLGFAAA